MTANGLYCFIEGLAVSFFLILGLQNLWQRGNRLRRILGAILLYWALQYLLSVLFMSDILATTRDFNRIFRLINMTAVPACAFLLLELCRPGWLTWRKAVLHEAPFVVLGLLCLFTAGDTLYYVLVGLFVVYSLAVMAATLVGISKYNRFLKAHYSYDVHVNLRWLYIVLVTFVVLMAGYAVCSLCDTRTGDIFFMATSLLSWAWICYSIQRQESVLGELEQAETAATADAEASERGDSDAPELETAIRKHFIDKQLYLDPSLKLGDMAKAIGTNRTYLSRYLNDRLNTTFYDYINALRLAHAHELIERREHNITTIAAMAGFNSYSTFRRTFIAKYGLTPWEYRNQQKSSRCDGASSVIGTIKRWFAKI